jgi:hypothetical protein
MSWTFKIVDGDFVRDQSGRTGYEEVSGRGKLVQECKMILSTDIRADGVGSSLRKIVGKSSRGGDEIGQGVPLMFEFQLMVRNSIERYRNKQRNTLFSRRLMSELLDDFSPTYVAPDPDDARKFKWRVDFFTMNTFQDFSLGGTSPR